MTADGGVLLRGAAVTAVAGYQEGTLFREVRQNR